MSYSPQISHTRRNLLKIQPKFPSFGRAGTYPRPKRQIRKIFSKLATQILVRFAVSRFKPPPLSRIKAASLILCPAK
jgi:hypothetical protein